jgi:hypothetical protein
MMKSKNKGVLFLIKYVHIGPVLLPIIRSPKQKVSQSHPSTGSQKFDDFKRSWRCHITMFSYTTPFHYTSSLSLSYSRLYLSLRSVVWFHLVSPKMLARLAANRLNQIRQTFRQVLFPISHSISFTFSVSILSYLVFPLFTASEGFLYRSQLCKYPSSYPFHFSSLTFRFLCLWWLLILSIFEFGHSTLTLRTIIPIFLGNSTMPTKLR